MPFQSQAQRAFMFSQHPDIAKRWAATYGNPKNLPARKGAISRRIAKYGEKRKS